MTADSRQQRLLERIQEDERLRGDLAGEAATALIAWASDKVRAATDDPQRADEEVDAEVQRIRAAGREAARSGVSDPAQVVALAEAAFASSGAAPPNPPPAMADNAGGTSTQAPVPDDPPGDRTVRHPWFARVRRRWGERMRRWLD